MGTRGRITIAFAAGRIAFGIALVAAPRAVGTSWLGPAGEHPATQAALRGLGIRDLGLAAGAVWAESQGGAVRPWLIATVAGDLVDVGATIAAGDAIPRRGRNGTVALAGVSAIAGAALAAKVDR